MRSYENVRSNSCFQTQATTTKWTRRQHHDFCIAWSMCCLPWHWIPRARNNLLWFQIVMRSIWFCLLRVRVHLQVAVRVELVFHVSAWPHCKTCCLFLRQISYISGVWTSRHVFSRYERIGPQPGVYLQMNRFRSFDKCYRDWIVYYYILLCWSKTVSCLRVIVKCSKWWTEEKRRLVHVRTLRYVFSPFLCGFWSITSLAEPDRHQRYPHHQQHQIFCFSIPSRFSCLI